MVSAEREHTLPTEKTNENVLNFRFKEVRKEQQRLGQHCDTSSNTQTVRFLRFYGFAARIYPYALGPLPSALRPANPQTRITASNL